jgi:ABC-type oligopeptide transport system substrate-binding subunit
MLKKRKGESSMNKMLIAILTFALLMTVVAPSFAWYVPSTDNSNTKYNTWGPRVDNVLCVIHTGEEGEYNSFKSKLIDVFDWPFTPEQKAELDTADPSLTQWERVFYAEFGMYELDINNQVFPGSDINFRTALSKLMDKNTFISTYLNGMGQAAHSPLWHNPTWRFEPCAGFTSEIYNPTVAYQMLYDNGYRDWDSDGTVEYSPDGGTTKNEFTIILYGRSEDTMRTGLANEANNALTTSCQGSVIGAKFDIALSIVPRAITSQRVMKQYNYTLYTGGWSFGRDPDTLYFLYHSSFAIKPSPGGANYICYRSTGFDDAIDSMIGAGNFETAHYWCNESQRIFMSDVAMIPMWNTAGYSGFLSNVEHAIPMSAYQAGTSTAAYQTLMNAYMAGDEYGGTLRWGFMNDFEALSAYSAQWVWDWNILQEIYDSMIGYNPYDFAQDYGIMANEWEVKNWTYNGDDCTAVTWKLRQDLTWHDIPPKADRAYGIAPLGTGDLHVTAAGNPDPQSPMRVTAEDVAFTVNYIRGSDMAWNWGTVCDVVYCEVIDPYTVTLYYGLYMPIWALHWCGGLAMMPKFIWEKVPLELASQYDPLAEKTLSGCGPFTFNYTGYVPHQYVVLDRYPRYQDLSPADVYVSADGVRVDPSTKVNYTVQLANRDAEYTITGTLTVSADGAPVATIPDITLAPKATYETTLYATGALALGAHNVTASFDITGSPDWMHALDATYTHRMWFTIREDLDYNFKVNIVDITICAKAFGSRPGDLRWDSRADLNSDKKVDILDIARVARKFGFT